MDTDGRNPSDYTHMADIERILDCLERHQIRATYAAVGEVIGVIAIGVSRQLPGVNGRCSWVVNGETGLPGEGAGYRPDDLHPRLRSKRRIIRSGAELRELCGLCE